jgi:hypothetical protein
MRLLILLALLIPSFALAETAPYGLTQTFQFGLRDYDNPADPATGISFTAGDCASSACCTMIKDGVSSACTNQPVHVAAGVYTHALTNEDLQASKTTIALVDDAADERFAAKYYTVTTYGVDNGFHSTEVAALSEGALGQLGAFNGIPVSSSTNNTVTLAGAFPVEVGSLIGSEIILTDTTETEDAQVRVVTGNSGATITVARNWTNNPDSDWTAGLRLKGPVVVAQIQDQPLADIASKDVGLDILGAPADSFLGAMRGLLLANSELLTVTTETTANTTTFSVVNVLTAGGIDNNSQYVGGVVKAVVGANAGQFARIVSANASNNTITVSPAFAAAPNENDLMIITTDAAQFLQANQNFDMTGNITGNLSGSVGSVTDPVTAGTVSDKTGYSLTQSFPANFASLGINESGHISRVTLVDTTTANTDMRGTDNALLAASAPANFGDLAITSTTGRVTVGTNTDKTDYVLSTAGVSAVQSGLASDDIDSLIEDSGGLRFTDKALEEAPTGGSGGDSAADIYNYFTDESREDAFKADVSGLASQASVDGLNDLSEAEVKAQVVAALATDTYAELAVLPSSTPTIAQMLQFVYHTNYNRMTATNAEQTLFLLDNTTELGVWPLTTDGTTTVKGKIGAP